MSLPDELVSQLVKITNDREPTKNENIVYGKVVNDGDRKYVQLDGSDVLTPAVTTVEIDEDERVVVSIKNHTATIMGNTTNPAASVKRVGAAESRIEQTAEEIRLEVSNEVNGLSSTISQTAAQIRSEVQDEVRGLNSSITQNAESIETLVTGQEGFSKFQQTVEGFSFMGKGGTVKIAGGDLNLTGSISFSDLNADTQTTIKNATPKYQFSVDGVSWHDTMNADDKYRRDSTNGGASWSPSYQFRGTDGRDGSDASVPGYIKSTYIDSTTIISPTIYANDFNVIAEQLGKGSFNIHGYFGSQMWHFLAIEYYSEADFPEVQIYSPAGGRLVIGGRETPTMFMGAVDFTSATVTGLTAKFG